MPSKSKTPKEERADPDRPSSDLVAVAEAHIFGMNADEEKKRREEARARRQARLAALQGKPAAPVPPKPPLSSPVPTSVPKVPSSSPDNLLKEVKEEEDMFADDFKAGSGTKVRKVERAGGEEVDDAEGYLRARAGDVLGERYRMEGSSGGGVFSSVLLCTDLRSSSNTRVAVKVIRSQEVMERQAQRELQMLEEAMEMDKKMRKLAKKSGFVMESCPLVRLLGHFRHRGHLCLVFEPLAMSVRDVLRRYGRGIGLSIVAVREYGKALFRALHILEAAEIVHADVKPDNMLVSENMGRCVLSDLGSAFRVEDPDNTPTQTLVSRYYRAPEICLGFKPGTAIDTWSAACVLFELFTGDVLFTGRDNNEMLWHMQQTRGPVPKRLCRRHLEHVEANPLFETHFLEDGTFIHQVDDPKTGGLIPQNIRILTSDRRKEISARLAKKRVQGEDVRIVRQLTDLIESLLVFDPVKRPSPAQALKHPFFHPEPPKKEEEEE